MRRIIKLFEKGNVSVCGLKGTGKDMLFANVVIRRKLPYVSNTYYGGDYHPFTADVLNCRNTWRNFLTGDVKPYVYPYEDGTDIYIADGGVYMPSQHQGELVKEYSHVPSFMALSRHLGDANVHYNVQNLNRFWDKIREQSDLFLRCVDCWTLQKGFKTAWKRIWRKLPTSIRKRLKPNYSFSWVRSRLVVQRVILYENYDSAVNRVPPFTLRRPLLDMNRIQLWEIQKQNYQIKHGLVKPMILIYLNKSKYNTRIFKEMLENA